MSDLDHTMGGIEKLIADRNALLETIARLTTSASLTAKSEANAQITRAKARLDQLQVDIDKFHAG